MIRIAMWSGPRNLSTAMMRSFGARPDTSCVDEPFYAAFLKLTGAEHPMRAETLAGQENDPFAVADQLVTGSDTAVQYQKHMTHHMVDGIPREWMGQVRHAFLIRHPARVLGSYAKKRQEVTLSDIGFVQQTELFDIAKTLTGSTPVVVDSDDILRRPAEALSTLCDALSIPYTDDMLHWDRGPKPEDGPWAPHWYDGVWNSTGFGAAPAPLPSLPPELEALAAEAMPHYEHMAEHKITVD